MKYAIVVATRNRLDALSVSVPLFLGQTAQPSEIVIVDASDDHAAVRAFIDPFKSRSDIRIECVESQKRNLPAQRNIGVDHIEADIVLFPDDDAFWRPDTASGFLEAYAADTQRVIGGVNGIEVGVSPVANVGRALRKNRFIAFKRQVEPFRNVFEDTLFTHPFNVHAREKIAANPNAALIDNERFPIIPTLSGFRMSMRTEVARQVRFNETLGYAVGYGAHEDKNMSMRVLNAGYLLVGAPNAHVYHNTHPSKRAGGFSYGFVHTFNYLYTLAETAPKNGAAWRSVPRYMNYKLFLYWLRRGSEYSRDIHRGASVAYAERMKLMTAKPEDLDAVYRDICDRHIKR